MDHVDACHHRQHFASQVRGAPDAHRAVREFPRVGLGIVNEFLHVLHGNVVADHQQRRPEGNLRNGVEITHRVVPDVPAQGRNDRMRPQVREQDRVPVRRRFGDKRGRNCTSSARLALDEHRDTKGISHFGCKRPAKDVARPARRKDIHDADRLCGPGLAERVAGQAGRRDCKDARHCLQHASWISHFVPRRLLPSDHSGLVANRT